MASGRRDCAPAAHPGSNIALERLRILFEETLRRYPRIALDGQPAYVESPFVNQLKTLPVTLND